VAGAFAARSLDVILTTVPPTGDGCASVTLAIEELPLCTIVEFRVRLLIVAGVTAKEAVAVEPPANAEIVAFVLPVTGVVAIINVA